ncbi:protein of unknown function [Rhizobiales bacterium GAS188]|nr:protein of unknown function [Rhizobiales bacterium GAS188]
MKDATLNRPHSAAGGAKGRIRFRTTILQAGKTATGIQVPDDVVAKLASGKRPAVRITINGYTYRSTVAVMGGKFMVGVNAENRDKAKVAGGDEVDIDIELDIEPREVIVPPDFAAELNGDAKARQRFDALSYSKKKVLVQGIADAKTAETRQRRIDNALTELRKAAT